MANTTGKIAEVMFEEALDSINDQVQLANIVTVDKGDGAVLQNSGNTIWKTVEQQALIQDGFDLSGSETEIIEETYPCRVSDPKSDFVKQRIDDSNDMGFWERRGKRSGSQQVVELNTSVANAILTQGSGFYRSDATSGYDFIGEAQAMLNEEQRAQNMRNFILNDRDNLKFGADLAGRQTLQGRPEDVWVKGQIAGNVAEFDVHVGSYLPTLVGGASPDATVTGNQSFAPEGGVVNAANGTVTNIDYRTATIPVSDSSGYNVGDKVTFAGVNAIGVSDKQSTGRLKTFSIVSKPDGTSIEVYPKPIAADDSALSDMEKAYANVDTTIANTAVVTRLNTDASAKSNIWFDSDAIEIVARPLPAEYFKQFDGMKVIQETTKSGLPMYMVYDANIANLEFRYRLFTMWGVTVADPQRCGTSVSF